MVERIQAKYRKITHLFGFRSQILICWMIGFFFYMNYSNCRLLPDDWSKGMTLFMCVYFFMVVFDRLENDLQFLQVLVSLFFSWFLTAQYVGFHSKSLYLCKQPWQIKSVVGWVGFIFVYGAVFWFCFVFNHQKIQFLKRFSYDD